MGMQPERPHAVVDLCGLFGPSRACGGSVRPSRSRRPTRASTKSRLSSSYRSRRSSWMRRSYAESSGTSWRQVDFQGALLRGGFDVIWDSAHNDWILCAHVLAIDVPPGAWARLRALLRNAKPKWAKPNYFDASYFRPNFLVKVQHLHDRETQISDLVKFHTYFWPRQGAAGSPTPADRPAALTNWASRYTFKDFIFRFKMKRRE